MSAFAKLRRSSFRFQKALSAHVVVSRLEGFYTMTPQHCRLKKTQRGSEKQLKLGNTLVQSWPAGFRCRTFTMPVHDGHLLSLQNVRCAPLP